MPRLWSYRIQHLRAHESNAVIVPRAALISLTKPHEKQTMEISIKPIVTEKASNLIEKLNRYTFAVSPEANKYQIKASSRSSTALMFRVNTINVRSKNKSRWTKSGLLRGKTAAWKKALVTCRRTEY